MRLAPLLLQFAVMLAPKWAFAVEHDLLVTLEKKQSVISGVLNPGSLSFNGQEIYNSKENFAGLLLNGVQIEVTPVQGLQTFYTTTDQSKLELEWLQSDGSKKAILKVEYPALTEFKTDGSRLYFKFNEHVDSARLDTKEINIQEPEMQVDSYQNWLNEIHTLELLSKKNTSQIYNLDFRKLKSELLSSRSLSFMIARGPFSANVTPTAIGLGLRLLNEHNVSFDVAVMLARVTYVMGFGTSTNPVTQRTGQLKGRYGYNPFNTNPGSFSFKRLTLGFQTEVINYVRDSLYPSPIDGKNTDKVDIWYFQGGPFFRWEPLQYKDWGIFVNLDFRIFRTYSDLSSDGDTETFGISYYF